jgi:hypothetical protein
VTCYSGASWRYFVKESGSPASARPSPSAFDRGRHGEPVNAEPHKCAKIEWFPVDMLPPNTYPYTAACVRALGFGTK